MSYPKSPAQTPFDLTAPRHQYDMHGNRVRSHYPTRADFDAQAAQTSSLGTIADCDHRNAQRYGHFPELTIEQNRVIWEAREKGWDVFYPSWRENEPAHTYNEAIEFLKGAK